ncbi:myotilin-like isoform X4 [Macrobrachium nipponense]|uniref:myotilin-like isoform X4 n=1 Tax=Macrobrachium nipponense TaxID=159736 RepID=UPI0030C8299D
MGENFAPSFTQKPKLRQEDDGNKLIFDCQLSASPKPEIEWYRGDVQVKESQRIKINVKECSKNIHDVQLILDDVEEEDAGLYKVKAKNKYGEVSASINLNFSPVDEPQERQIDGIAPTFSQKPVIKQEEGGKHIKFECRILAEPKPAITWYRDGLKVQESARCKVSIEKDEKYFFITLSLANVTVQDAGKYKITAKNELGESNATISLNFDSSFMMLTGDEEAPAGDGVKPTFTERPVIRQSEDGSSVIFSCRCVGSPKPTVIW